jgi:hypothetical protein
MDIDDKIKELLPTGMTFLEIGKQIGMTRNAVAGRVSRMRQRGEIDNQYRTVEKRAEPDNPLERIVRREAKVRKPPKVIELSVAPDVNIGGIHLLDLREEDCRPRRDLRTRYCAKHHTIVWVKGSAPKDRKQKE